MHPDTTTKVAASEADTAPIPAESEAAAPDEGKCVAAAYGEPWCRGRCVNPKDCTARPRAGGKIRLLTLDALDRRTASYRATVDLIEMLESDLGGADQLSAAKRQRRRH